MDIRYNNTTAPSFGRLKLKIPINKFAEERNYYGLRKINQVTEEVADCKFWHIIVDESGYKLESDLTSNVYEIKHKPKRPRDKCLYIRTVNPNHKVQGKITSFKVDLNSYAEAKDLYQKIISASGLDKMVIIVRALEEQVLRRNGIKH